MKKIILLFLLLPAIVKAQTPIPNADFENWTINSYDDLNSPWITSNPDLIASYSTVNVKKVTGYNSTYAVRMENYVSGTDTMPGYIINTEGDPLSGEGGVPFSQKPTAIAGYWRYNIPGNDTGVLLVVFKKNGTVISTDFFHIKGTGSQSTFAAFSFPISLPVTPDSVIIAAVCTNVLGSTGMKATSWLELDSLRFTGPGITQTLVNGNFEGWTTQSIQAPDDWNTNGSVSRTTDKYSGTYAVKMTSVDDGMGGVNAGSIDIMVPYTRMANDTLAGYYKYTTPGSDNAMVFVVPFDANGPVGSFTPVTLAPQASYTYFKIPFSSTSTPDMLDINFMSSDFNSGSGVANSMLYVDKLQIIHEATTGVDDINNSRSTCIAYPNPANDVLNFSINSKEANALITITDAMGKTVSRSSHILRGNTTISIPVSTLVKGLYFYQVQAGNTIIKNKFIKD